MANKKHYLEKDVLTAAKERIAYAFAMFDSIVVNFSGGKDSLVTLHLVKEVMAEQGIKGKVNIVFRDEELIHQEVLDFVEEYKSAEWANLHWLCIQDLSQVYILNKSFTYIHWDNDREWVRQPPEYAKIYTDKIYDNFTKDLLIAELFPGKVGLLLGTRADESMGRYASFMGKINDSYITKASGSQGSAKYSLVKPLYDWTENDIFKYFYDNQIKYCSIYDAQLYANKGLRVAGPLHSESAKHLDKLKTTDPDLYAKCLKLFPDVAAQERYGRHLSKKMEIAEYGKSFDTIRLYILNTVDDIETLNYCLKILKNSKSLHYNYPKAYPIEHIAKQFISGRVQSKHVRGIMPLGKEQQAKNETANR